MMVNGWMLERRNESWRIKTRGEGEKVLRKERRREREERRGVDPSVNKTWKRQ